MGGRVRSINSRMVSTPGWYQLQDAPQAICYKFLWPLKKAFLTDDILLNEPNPSEMTWHEVFLGGGNSIFFGIFTLKIGEDFQFDEHIFQMGWNHPVGCSFWSFAQLMVDCWFGLVVWIPRIPLWKGLGFLGVPRFESQTTRPQTNK